jgi:dephospho-CoA kinase
MAVIGLTGGFLTGKSTVADWLRKQGYKVIDTDSIYHNKVLNRKQVKDNLAAAFGRDIFSQGRILRSRLRKEISKDKSYWQRLNSITHPYIIEELTNMIRENKKKEAITLAEVPLLYERRLEPLFDKVIVVSSDVAQQLKRAKKKGYSEEEAFLILKEQMPIAEKEKKADKVIRNNKGLEDLYEQNKRILKWLKKQVIKNH